MKSNMLEMAFVTACLLAALMPAGAQAAGTTPSNDRGFHLFRNENLTISPFIDLSYTYDSNVDYDKAENDDSSLTLNPGVDFWYKGNNWGLDGRGWYGYEFFKDYDELDSERYGEQLNFYLESEKGWRLNFGESYTRTEENDSILDGGRGIWRDREMFEFTGAFSYQLSEKTSVSLSGMYSMIDYKENNNEYAPLYGWDEWSANLEIARQITKKSNLVLSGGIQSYTSDGTTQGVDDHSMGYSIMGGFSSRATERITYRALTGASFFDYGTDDMQTGWTYSLDVNWVLNKKWGFTVAGSSYFQPSEREQNQATQVYTISGGLTYRPVRKLSLTADLAYRHEDEQFSHVEGPYSYGDERDVVSARVGARYDLVRTDYLKADIFATFEYDNQMSDENYDEFDDYRLNIGLRLFY